MGGLLAFCGALFTTVWLLLNTSITTSRFPDEKYLPLLVGSLFASVTVLIIHGLIDDPFYSTKALLFLFFIPGLVVSLQSPEDKSINIFPQMTLGLSVASVIAVLIIFAFRSSLLAAFQANLGAVAMAKVELQTWPNIEWNDERNLTYLAEAEDLFGKALTYSPTNRTARQRLGSIAMLRGDYDEAIVHLEAANQVDLEHRGVRKTLGYSYVWAGEIDSALKVLEGIPEAEEELKTYVWWWGTKGRDDLVAQADTIVTEMVKQTP
jgi:tetratricopeptide (TPR) repeat protein